jgi:hypothetical protein
VDNALKRSVGLSKSLGKSNQSPGWRHCSTSVRILCQKCSTLVRHKNDMLVPECTRPLIARELLR